MRLPTTNPERAELLEEVLPALHRTINADLARASFISEDPARALFPSSQEVAQIARAIVSRGSFPLVGYALSFVRPQALHGWLSVSGFHNAPWWNALLRLCERAPTDHPVRAQVHGALVDIQYRLIERELLEHAHDTARAYSTDLGLVDALDRLGWRFSSLASRARVLVAHSEGEWVGAVQALASFRYGRSVARIANPEVLWMEGEGSWDASGWGYDPDRLFTNFATAALR